MIIQDMTHLYWYFLCFKFYIICCASVLFRKIFIMTSSLLFTSLSCFDVLYLPRVYQKSPLYPHKVGVRSAYIPLSPNPTCGVTLRTLLLLIGVGIQLRILYIHKSLELCDIIYMSELSQTTIAAQRRIILLI